MLSPSNLLPSPASSARVEQRPSLFIFAAGGSSDVWQQPSARTQNNVTRARGGRDRSCQALASIVQPPKASQSSLIETSTSTAPPAPTPTPPAGPATASILVTSRPHAWPAILTRRIHLPASLTSSRSTCSVDVDTTAHDQPRIYPPKHLEPGS